MKIKAFASRYEMTLGEGPGVLIAPEAAEDWYGRDPFVDQGLPENVSSNLVMAPEGTTDGHNVLRDSTFMDSLRVDKYVPLAPLFVKDLCGRIVYTGYGPDRKGNSEWSAYAFAPETPPEELNPFIPLCVFPRFCREVEEMEGKELLEQVFLTKFRCLEMSLGYNGMISGADEDDALVAATYVGANLYPYKLRLDTYYTDGWKLPQTQMVYARGPNMGVARPEGPIRLGEDLLNSWKARPQGMGYEDWIETLGPGEVERLYMRGCTVIPTFDACNGYHVVNRNFELDDYWPGRAVLGLHDIVERRADKSPVGTILDVIEPGYVTATKVHPAKVIVSDGSGYVSPNYEDPLPLVPNLFLPHQRTMDNWDATWLPTHPEHFEVPAIWGWELNAGRFMQLSGPIWDPLHYYYESVDKVLAAFDAAPLTEEKPLVPVPEEMEHRFYPIIPIKGFDTFSKPEYDRRMDANLKPRSCIKRIATENIMAGIGYHPMPAEFEFELDSFWFPDLHPLNRGQGPVPDDLKERIVPIINPRVMMSMFVPTVEMPEEVTWMTDQDLLFTPVSDPLVNYPQLTRYLMPEADVETIMKLCPVPYLGDPGAKIAYPPSGWWLSDDDMQLDGPMALQDVLPNMYDALWDMRQEGVDIVKLRHMIYQTNLPLYMLGWWYGWDVKELGEKMDDWIKTTPPMVSTR